LVVAVGADLDLAALVVEEQRQADAQSVAEASGEELLEGDSGS
jgi:hypothetical protein